jgi:5-methyltetrahydrofolate--homocysteine methyltransferase
METILKGKEKEVIISPERQTRLIGEKINPTNNKLLEDALNSGRLSILRKLARVQVEAGADILDINVAAAGVDETKLLPEAVRIVMDTVDVPVCIDSRNIKALWKALKVHKEIAPNGKPIINSVTIEYRLFDRVFPLVADHGAAVIGLTMEKKPPEKAEKRLEIAHYIIVLAKVYGIPKEDVIIDCIAETVAVNDQAGRIALDAMKMVRDELGVNMTLGISNISYGMPERETLNQAFLDMAILNGVTCPIVDVAKVRRFRPAGDLLMGRDPDCRRYLQGYRERGTKD